MRRIPIRLCPLAVIVIASMWTATVRAKILYVDRKATGIGDGSSWVNAFINLQTALDVAQEADEIRVAQGVYIPTQSMTASGSSSDRAFAFDKALNLKGGYAGGGHGMPDDRDMHKFRTVLSGDQEGDDRREVGVPYEDSFKQDNSRSIIRWLPDRGKTTLIEGFYISASYHEGGDGSGAIQAWLSQECELIVRDCSIVDNSGDIGGGMCVYGKGYDLCSVSVENCSLYSNIAERGAGAYVSDTLISFTNCVFNTNEAIHGGALYLSASLAEFTNCTFSHNRADAGEALYCEWNLCLLQNCVIWDCIQPIHIDLSTVFVQYSNIVGGFNGKGNIEADPLFVNPRGMDGIHGTEDDNLQLLPISPCVNSGSIQDWPENIAVDINGHSRVLGGLVDMGAYEFQGTIYVDADAPNDPGPADPLLSDPNENGTQKHPFDSVSEAMEFAWDGFTVLVAAGVYEPVDARSDTIRFEGRNIRLMSLYPQDLMYARATKLGYSVEFDGTEGPGCELAGFMMQSSDSLFRIAGNNTQATLRSCILQGNNTCDGIVLSQWNGLMENCLIVNNTSSFDCGGFPVVRQFSGTMQNCTVANNATNVHLLATARVNNCIIYHNQVSNLSLEGTNPPQLAYSNIQGFRRSLQDAGFMDFEFKGLLDEDPRFVCLGQWSQGHLIVEGDYHLKSRGLRWLENGDPDSGWLRDSVTSPCIDTGDPNRATLNEWVDAPVSGDGLEGINTRINMGYYGGTEQASFLPILPIQNVTATASSSLNSGMRPENTVNRSGLDEMDRHSTVALDMWLSAADEENTWIQYTFDQTYVLHKLWVWNSNQLVERIFGFGAKKVTIETSLDGENWTALADVPEFAQASGNPEYMYNTVVRFAGEPARYVKLWIHDGYGFISQYGLSEVRFFMGQATSMN